MKHFGFKVRRSAFAAATAFVLVSGGAAAYAATLETDVLLSSAALTPTAVNVGTTTFDIKVTATGNLPDNSNNTGTFRVTTVYNMAADGTVSADATQYVEKTIGVGYNYTNCPTTGIIPLGCAGNPVVVTATLNVAAGAEGRTGTVVAALTGSNGLSTDPTPDRGYVTVLAPVATNSAPVVSLAAADASGEEGDTLSTGGAFTDADEDTLTVTKVSGEGEVTDNGDGSWSWSLGTTDNGSGTVVVQASDGELSVTDSFDWSATNVAPVVATPALTRLGACTVGVSAGFSDKGSADTHAASIAWGDDTSQAVDPATTPVTGSHVYTTAGSKTVSVSVTDDDGATGTASNSFTTLNTPSALMQPVNASGTRSVFKLGSTIPLKITVTDCAGQQVSTLSPTVALYKLDSTADGSVSEQAVDATPTNGKNMRWADTQYIYNLSSKLSQFTGSALGAGTYRVEISDPSFVAPVTATFDLKK